MTMSPTFPLLYAAFRALRSGNFAPVAYKTFPIVDGAPLPAVITVFRKVEVKRHEVRDGRVFAVLPYGAWTQLVRGDELTPDRLSALREAHVLTYHAVAKQHDLHAVALAGPREVAVCVGTVH